MMVKPQNNYRYVTLNYALRTLEALWVHIIVLKYLVIMDDTVKIFHRKCTLRKHKYSVKMNGADLFSKSFSLSTLRPEPKKKNYRGWIRDFNFTTHSQTNRNS